MSLYFNVTLRRPTFILTSRFDAISTDKRRRIARAAEAYLARNPSLAVLDLRFDALLLGRGYLPRHIPDAWRP